MRQQEFWYSRNSGHQGAPKRNGVTSGRVDEKFVWHAFAKGAPVVLISGCHIGDCHYTDANHWTEKRVEKKVCRR
ncbi:MAG: hydrogenase iron-sulfur subunit [Thermodesulfobacteriota bacterium]